MSKPIERTFPPAHKLFARAAFGLAQEGVLKQPVERLLDHRNVVNREILARASVAVGMTTTTGWAAEIAAETFGAYVGSLAPYSGAARLIALAQTAKLPRETAANYPTRAAGPSAAPWVGEGDPIPISASVLSNVKLGPQKKLSSIVVWSSELGKRSDADTIFETMLREDFIAGIDSAFFSTTALSSSAVAGLLNGVTALVGYGGGDDVAMKTDLMALASAVAASGSGTVTFVMAPERLAKARILAPALTASLDVAASAAIPADRIVAADAAALLVALDPEPELFASTQGTLHMDSSPTQLSTPGSPPTVAAPIRSLFQTGTMAVRLIHEMAFAKKRSTAVAYLDGATW